MADSQSISPPSRSISAPRRRLIRRATASNSSTCGVPRRANDQTSTAATYCQPHVATCVSERRTTIPRRELLSVFRMCRPLLSYAIVRGLGSCGLSGTRHSAPACNRTRAWLLRAKRHSQPARTGDSPEWTHRQAGFASAHLPGDAVIRDLNTAHRPGQRQPNLDEMVATSRLRPAHAPCSLSRVQRYAPGPLGGRADLTR